MVFSKFSLKFWELSFILLIFRGEIESCEKKIVHLVKSNTFQPIRFEHGASLLEFAI